MAKNKFEKENKCNEAPPWLTTFSDLMSLLLCFFVLLLSFSEMDVAKYKEIAGSLREAFGVQRREPVQDIPKGMDIIAREFNPKFPEDFITNAIKSALRQLMEEGDIEVRKEEFGIVVSIKDKLLFSPGSAKIKPQFYPFLRKLQKIMEAVDTKVKVVGHTDNIPIRSSIFPSNWELSAARAAAVVRFFLRDKNLDPRRFEAIGKADSEPIAPNDTPKDRAKNRRVEIVFITRGPYFAKGGPVIDREGFLGTRKKKKGFARWPASFWPEELKKVYIK